MPASARGRQRGSRELWLPNALGSDGAAGGRCAVSAGERAQGPVVRQHLSARGSGEAATGEREQERRRGRPPAARAGVAARQPESASRKGDTAGRRERRCAAGMREGAT